MTALPAEVESAVAEGVELMELEAPVRIDVDAFGRCTALVTQPQMIGPVRAGRPAPVAAGKPERRMAADVVLIAVGQDVVSAPFEAFGMKAARGRFLADDGLAAEGQAHVFVGGDCQTGPSTVIRAIAAGKVAARAIDGFLGYCHKLPGDGPKRRRPGRTTGRPRGAWSWPSARRGSASGTSKCVEVPA